MTPLDQQFHISQSRLKSHPVKRTVSVKCGPVELTSINAHTNPERLALYVAKREIARSAA